jgi:signal transduction histidine kinase
VREGDDVTEQRCTELPPGQPPYRRADDRDELAALLTAQRMRLEEIFEHSPSLIAVTSGPEHRVELANPLFMNTFGPGPLLGRNIGDALAGPATAALVPVLDAAYAGGRTWTAGEQCVCLPRADGSTEEFWFNFVLQPLCGADGAVRGLLLHAVDVTLQVRACQEAERASSAKRDFLAIMSHELRTPLNAMIGYSDLLLAGIPEAIPGSARAKVERIGLSARHLLQLIDEILTFSRLEAGEERVRAADADVEAVLREVQALVEPMAVAKRIALRCDLPVRPLHLVTDVHKLRQILLNLIGNAIKFTDEGVVQVDTSATDATISFHVRDTGPGIAPEHAELIFEAFWQVERGATRSKEGTGLGLSVARRLARLLGGDIAVASTPGAGARFTLTLPRVPA